MLIQQETNRMREKYKINNKKKEKRKEQPIAASKKT